MVLKKQQYIQCICLQNNSTTRGVSNQSIRPFIPTPYSQAAHNNSQPSICNHSIPLHIKSILNPAVKTAIKSQSLLNSFIRIEAKSKKKKECPSSSVETSDVDAVECIHHFRVTVQQSSFSYFRRQVLSAIFFSVLPQD